MRAAAYHFATSAEKEEIGHILARRPATAFAAGRHFTQKKYRVILRSMCLYMASRAARNGRRAIHKTENKKMKTPHIGAFIISPARYTGLYGGDDRTRICDLLHVKQAL